MKYLVRSSALGGFDLLVSELGGDPIALMERAHLHPSVLASPDIMVSYRAVARLLNHCAAELGVEDFGVRLGHRQGLELLGALGPYLCLQGSLNAAFEAGLKALGYHVRGLNIVAQSRPPNTVISVGFQFEHEVDCTQLSQLTLSNIAHIVRELSGGACLPDARLGHPGTLCNHLVFRTTDLAQPIRVSDALKKRLFASWRQPEYALGEGIDTSLSEQVKTIIQALLPTGDINLESIARVMEMPPRTLQCKLQKRDTSYGEVLKQCRQQLACQWLLDAEISITDIALRLGYAEAAVFNRAFKSWYGQAPSHWRREQQANPGDPM